MTANTKNSFFKDLSWYFIGSAIPMVIGLFRVPIFTRYFTPEEYGVYGIVYITYFIISIFLLNWLSNCIWRFYNEYKNKNKLNLLYNNLFILYIIFSVVFLVIAITWNSFTSNDITKKLTLLVFFQLLINSIINYILIVFRLEGKAAFFNVITVLRGTLSFGSLALLTFAFKFRIEAIPISMLIIDLLILPFVIIKFISLNNIKAANISKQTLSDLFKFSLPSILSTLGLYLLTSSDRYVIALYNKMDKVGIYNQVYNLCQVSMMAVINLYFSIINPDFVKKLTNSIKEASKPTSIYLTVFILVVSPLTFYLSTYGDIVANIMLGEKFREGSKMIPWLMSSVFLYGITLFPENRLKFASKYRVVITGFLSCSVINLLINFLAIPYYTYQWAAISTFISYFCLMIYFYIADYKLNNYSFHRYGIIFSVIIFLAIEYAIHFALKSYFNTTSGIITEITILIILYILFVYIFHRKSVSALIHIYN